MPTVTPSELDLLAAFWNKDTGTQDRPLKLADLHKAVAARRANHGEAEPAITTISTQLRSLILKGLVRDAAQPESHEGGTRGILTPATRSSGTGGYVHTQSQAQVLADTFKGLASLYPNDQRHEAVLDFIRALELSPEQLRVITKELAKTKPK